MSSATKKPTIRCMLDVSLEGVFFNPSRPEGIKFAVGAGRRTKLLLRPQHPDKAFDRELELKVIGRFEVAAFERQFIASLIAKRFLSYPDMGFALPLVGQSKRVLIDNNGNISDGYIPRRDLYPRSLQLKCSEIENDLKGIAARFFKLLRWQQAIEGPPQPMSSATLYWQVERGPFYFVGQARAQPVTSPWPAGIMWDEQDRVALSQLWKKKKAEEPIAHELLREANHLAEDTPLSALLIAASALEVGAKSYVSALVPAAEWLVENLPAPPTYKILKDYISQLPTRVAVDWSKLKKLFTTAKELAEERNKVTHSTGHVPSKEKLQTFLNCVSELLYIIDVSQGHEWAKDHVTKATRGMLGWTLSRKRSGRGFVTLRIGD